MDPVPVVVDLGGQDGKQPVSPVAIGKLDDSVDTDCEEDIDRVCVGDRVTVLVGGETEGEMETVTVSRKGAMLIDVGSVLAA